MSLTVLETALVADSVADFSVSFKSFALVEMVSAMDAGDNGAGGKASAMVSGAAVAAGSTVESGAAGVASDSGAVDDSDSGATCDSSIDEGALNDSGTSSGCSYETGSWTGSWTGSCLGVISRPFSFMSFVSHRMIFLAMRSSLYSRGG